MKPKLFVASSVEGLDIAYAVQQNLQHDAEVTVWPQGVFELSKSSLESLATVLERSDFAAFVFTPDDVVTMRSRKVVAARDNVVFELGLFIGRLGRERCFILTPDGDDLHIASDLIGMTPGKYETGRSDNSMQAATGPACNEMRSAIRGLGPTVVNAIANEGRRKNLINSNKRNIKNRRRRLGLMPLSRKTSIKPSICCKRRPIPLRRLLRR